MLKIDQDTLDQMERRHNGIAETIRRFEQAALPACAHCGSGNTADVQCGIVGRTMDIAAATTKFKLIANGPKPGAFFCHSCGAYFD